MSVDEQPRAPGAPAPAPDGVPGRAPMSKGVKLLLGCAVAVPLLVCSLGVCSATAIPAFLRYVTTTKAAEAEVNVAHLADAVRARCEQGAPPVSAGPLPPTPSSTKQPADFGADAGFAALGFATSEAVYYRYTVLAEADGSTVIRAEGDLDGDGTRSLYEVRCGTSCTCGELHSEQYLE